MLDAFANNAMTILSISIGGVSIGTILCLTIWLIKVVKRNRRDIKITKESIIAGFKEVVIPKTIKLDLSKKIEKPLIDGFAKVRAEYEAEARELREGLALVLKILSKFSHVGKLSEDDQDAINDYIDETQMNEEG